MSLDPSKPKIRVVSGSPGEVERELNLIMDYYTSLNWSFLAVGERVVMTVTLISNEVIERQQRAMRLAGATMPPGRA